MHFNYHYLKSVVREEQLTYLLLHGRFKAVNRSASTIWDSVIREDEQERTENSWYVTDNQFMDMYKINRDNQFMDMYKIHRMWLILAFINFTGESNKSIKPKCLKYIFLSRFLFVWVL